MKKQKRLVLSNSDFDILEDDAHSFLLQNDPSYAACYILNIIKHRIEEEKTFIFNINSVFSNMEALSIKDLIEKNLSPASRWLVSLMYLGLSIQEISLKYNIDDAKLRATMVAVKNKPFWGDIRGRKKKTNR